MRHVPVLLKETVDQLRLLPGMNIVDCTLGDGGHAETILNAIAPTGRLLGIDADPESLLRAKQFLYQYGDRVIGVRDNFVHLKEIVSANGFYPINGIVMDLGWSSPQFADRGRGFSFEGDEPLEMLYSGKMQDANAKTQTAADMLNQATEPELEKLLREYGEEGLSREIARAIVVARKAKPIERTSQLVEIILQTYRTKLKTTKEVPWVGGLHPATKVFQALRIAVNDELGVLERVIPDAIDLLSPGGRLAIITFHSLEDRIVKHAFRSTKTAAVITKKPITCDKKEFEENPRARSAKLRVIEKNF